MTERIVDGLEIVQVQKQHSHHLRLAPCGGKHHLEAIHDQRAVWQMRKRVVMSKENWMRASACLRSLMSSTAVRRICLPSTAMSLPVISAVKRDPSARSSTGFVGPFKAAADVGDDQLDRLGCDEFGIAAADQPASVVRNMRVAAALQSTMTVFSMNTNAPVVASKNFEPFFDSRDGDFGCTVTVISFTSTNAPCSLVSPGSKSQQSK